MFNDCPHIVNSAGQWAQTANMQTENLQPCFNMHSSREPGATFGVFQRLTARQQVANLNS